LQKNFYKIIANETLNLNKFLFFIAEIDNGANDDDMENI